MEGAAAPQSGAPCRCGNTRRSSVSMLSTDDEREGGNNAPISEHGRSPSSPWLGDGPSSALETLKQAGIGMLAGMFVLSGAGGDVAAALAEGGGAGITAPTSSVTVQDLQRYDGFEDYAAQGQQMENSDVGCFANECKRETASCFTDGSCLKVCVKTSDPFSCCLRDSALSLPVSGRSRARGRRGGPLTDC